MTFQIYNDIPTVPTGFANITTFDRPGLVNVPDETPVFLPEFELKITPSSSSKKDTPDDTYNGRVGR